MNKMGGGMAFLRENGESGNSGSRNSIVVQKSGRSGSSSNTPPSSGDLQSTPDEDSLSFDESNRKLSSNFALSPGSSGKKSLKNLRNGAKTFFKKGSKK